MQSEHDHTGVHILHTGYGKEIVATKHIGWCPHCGMMLCNYDINNIKVKHKKSLRVTCKRCQKSAAYHLVPKRNPFRSKLAKRRVRKRHAKPHIEQIITEFINLFNLTGLVTPDMIEKYRQYLLKRKISMDTIIFAELTAAKRTKFNLDGYLSNVVSGMTKAEVKPMSRVRRRFNK